MADLEKLVAEAMVLNAQDRASLAEQLLRSLDELNEEEAESLWAAEAQRRLGLYKASGAKSISSSQLATKAEHLLG